MSELHEDQAERQRLNKHRLMVRDHINQIEDKHDKLCTLFYTHLFRINPDLTHVFNGGVPMLNRKFNSMLSTFKNLKDLEKMTAALESMAERHVPYHAEPQHLPQFKEAFLLSLEDISDQMLDSEVKSAWNQAFDEIIAIMTRVLKNNPNTGKYDKEDSHDMDNFLEEIGGESKVHQVHERFYTYIYDDDFIGNLFQHRAKSLLVRKQSEFMIAAFGGKNDYTGEPPAFVHMHMFITKEMSDIRNTYLRNAILEEGLSEEQCNKWLKVDQSFHAAIEKTTPEECVMRVPGQFPMVAKKPAAYKPPKDIQIAK